MFGDTTYVIYEDSGVIYILRDDNFLKLYDFNAELNDTVVVSDDVFQGFRPFNDNYYNDFKYTITDIDFEEIDGLILKKQSTNATSNPLSWGFGNSTILEHIGSTIIPFGFPNTIYPEFNPFLRCYTDSFISYYNPDFIYDCDYITSNISIVDNSPLVIFPSVVTDFLFMKHNSNSEFSFKFYNINGVLLYPTSIVHNEGFSSINLQHFERGLYILQVDINSDQIFKMFLKI